MLAVILAGGFGTRLSEETQKKPKPLVEIGDKPILWHIMKNLSTYGFKKFIILAGYKSYSIKEYFINYYLHRADVKISMSNNKIEYLHNYSENWDVSVIDTGLNTMTGGRLLRVKHLLPENEPFLFTYGDGLSDIDINALISSHKKSGKLATVTAVYPPARFGALEINDDGSVESFQEKPIAEMGRINGGFFILEKKSVEFISDDQTVWEESAISGLVREKQLNAYIHSGFWQPMDTLREKNKLEKLWSDKSAPWRNW